MRKINSYALDETPNVQPHMKYVINFKNPGQFEIEEADNRINIMCDIWPGTFDGEKWNEKTDTEGQTCAIFVYYHNKGNILVMIDASYGYSEEVEKSFEFIREAAKKFFLKSDCITYDPRSYDGLRWV